MDSLARVPTEKSQLPTPPPVFFVRVANKGLILDVGRKSGRERSYGEEVDSRQFKVEGGKIRSLTIFGMICGRGVAKCRSAEGTELAPRRRRRRKGTAPYVHKTWQHDSYRLSISLCHVLHCHSNGGGGFEWDCGKLRGLRELGGG